MAALRRALLRLWRTFGGARADEEATREIEAHLALIEDDFIRRGAPRAEARRQAQLALGGTRQAKELHRDARVFVLLDDLQRDARYALRSLARTPGFTAVAVLTLALGIGANTAIFSVVHAVLISPLPFRHADRLVTLYENIPGSETRNGRPRRQEGLDVREFLEVRARARTLSAVTTRGLALVSVAGAADNVEGELTSISAGTLPMLGVYPALGRWFEPQEELPGHDNVIILSYTAWQRYFAGDPTALGKTIAFNGNTFSAGVALGADFTIVGVMPKGFHFPDDTTQFWTPLVVTPPADPRRTQMSTLMAQLADGASADAATAEISAIVRAIRETSANGPKVDADASWDRPDGSRPRFEMVRAQDEVGARVKPALLVLTGAVLFVLLIACANVANLLLARTSVRQREIAIRIAVGAGRARLFRQLLTESIVLSGFGGLLGVLLATGGVRLFRGLAANMARVDLGALGNTFPRLDAIGINAPVMAFVAVTSVVTGMLFGLLPALRHARSGHMDVLRGATAATAATPVFGRRVAAQSVLVVVELSVATVLAIGGGLLIHSFARLARIDPGYNASNVLTFQVGLPGPTRATEQLKSFADGLVTRLELIPGVQAAAYANQLPLVKLQNTMSLTRTPGAAPTPGRGGDVQLVSRDYLKVMGVRVLAGRSFGDGDTAGRPQVLIVNRAMAARDFADKSPVGETVFAGRNAAPWKIVGVVDNVRTHDWETDPPPQFFLTLDQWSSTYGVPVFPAGAYYAIRTSGTPAQAMARIQEAVHQLEPRASIENIATMNEIISNEMTQPRMFAVLLGVFAGVAVFLSAAGIYGVVAYSVVQRTREIGIRMALGARRAEVVALVLSQSALLTVIGTAVGIAGAAATTRYLQSFLFDLTPLDPSTFAVVAALFMAIATLASYVPARRASRVDPLVALRAE